jgi:hypothetical protein
MLFSFAWISAATGIIIDDFSVGAVDVSGGNSVIQSGLSPSHVVGGERDVYLGRGNLTIDISNTWLALSTTPPDSHFNTVLRYGRTTPLFVDFTADGSDRFVFEFNVAPQMLYVYLTSIRPDGTIDDNYVGLQQPNVATIELPFADFPNVDLTNVGLIHIAIRQEPAIMLGSIRTVPEPCLMSWHGVIVLLSFFRRPDGHR